MIRLLSRPLLRLLALVTLTLAMLAPGLASAQAQPLRDRQVDVVRDHPNDGIETLRLACHVDVVGDQRGVLCRWSASSRDDVRGYQLYRIVNGSPRELVATVPVGDRLHAFDTDLLPGDRVIYGVVARNHAGRVIGVGGPVRLGIDG